MLSSNLLIRPQTKHCIGRAEPIVEHEIEGREEGRGERQREKENKRQEQEVFGGRPQESLYSRVQEA